MSKEARSWASRQRVCDRTLMLVLVALAWAADKGTGECRKSQGAIADEANLTDRAVRSSLVVLERLEIIARKPRSKGRYGRTTDLITLALDRNFDVSRAAIQAVRKTLKLSLQPEPRAGSKKSCNRNRVPLQPEPRSGEYNLVDLEDPYQEEETSKVEGLVLGETQPPTDRETLTGVVVPFRTRGAA